MREILFRGKRVDNGKWIEGFYVRIGKSHFIFTGKLKFVGLNIDFECYEVTPETVGQYTGLTDKNGNKIFEDDIVLFEDESPHNYEYHDDAEMRCGVMEYDDGQFYLSNRIVVTMDILIYDGELDGEVIGNVFDNADLFEVQQ